MNWGIGVILSPVLIESIDLKTNKIYINKVIFSDCTAGSFERGTINTIITKYEEIKMRKIIGAFLVGVLLIISGCLPREDKIDTSSSGEEIKREESKTKLKWALFNLDSEMVKYQDALNEILEDKGLLYEIEFADIQIDFNGDYKAYINSYIEELKVGNYDIVDCPGIWFCYDTYTMMIQEGILSSWNQFLESTEGKLLKNAYPDVVWDYLQYNDNIYGVLTPFTDINYYAVFNLNYAEKYKIDVFEVTWPTLEGYLQKVRDGEIENEEFIVSTPWPYLITGKYEPSLCDLIYINTNTDIPVAESLLDNEDYLKYIQMQNNWCEQGLVSGENAEFWTQQIMRGNFFVTGRASYSPEAAENFIRNRYGISEEIRLQAVEIPEFNQSFCGKGAKMGISTNSQNQEAAYEVLAAIYSDEDLSNALVYGKKDVDYFVEDGTVICHGEDNIVELFRSTRFGNRFLTLPGCLDSIHKKEELWETVEQNKCSISAGFYWDISEVDSDVIALKSLALEKYTDVLNGTYKDGKKGIEILCKEVEKYNIENVIVNLNRQLESFYKERNK